tara:strand:- start:283 stop:507 length:225 start_codon:yes stop_codon:yes gene_type:complete
MFVRGLWDMKPDYYNSMKITPIDYITANELDFCSGNIVKYASRWNKKGTPVEDLRKIVEYANLLIGYQMSEEKG